MSVRIAVALTTLLVPLAGHAAEVYRWVDDDGVVHYSQWMPESRPASLTIVEVPDATPADYEPATDPYSILNQSIRIHETFTAVTENESHPTSSPADAPAHPPNDDPAISYRTQLFVPTLHRPVPRDPLRVQRHQLPVIDEIERRNVPRSPSINSSGHRARVAASEQAVETVLRQPGKFHRH